MGEEKEGLRPFDFLNNCRNKRVLVELKKENTQVVGTLLAFDISINILLEDASEVTLPMNGNKKVEGRAYKTLFIKGDNVRFVSPGQ